MKRLKKLTDPEDLANARLKYQSAINLKTSEGEIQWARYNCMLVVNGAFTGLIFLTYSNSSVPVFLTILLSFVPILGLLLCYLWYNMTQRGFMWTNFWITEANRIEDQIDGEINPVQEGNDFRSNLAIGVTKNASLLIIKVFGVIYLVLLLINVYRLGTLFKFF